MYAPTDPYWNLDPRIADSAYELAMRGNRVLLVVRAGKLDQAIVEMGERFGVLAKSPYGIAYDDGGFVALVQGDDTRTIKGLRFSHWGVDPKAYYTMNFAGELAISVARNKATRYWES